MNAGRLHLVIVMIVATGVAGVLVQCAFSMDKRARERAAPCEAAGGVLVRKADAHATPVCVRPIKE